MKLISFEWTKRMIRSLERERDEAFRRFNAERAKRVKLQLKLRGLEASQAAS